MNDGRGSEVGVPGENSILLPPPFNIKIGSADYFVPIKPPHDLFGCVFAPYGLASPTLAGGLTALFRVLLCPLRAHHVENGSIALRPLRIDHISRRLAVTDL